MEIRTLTASDMESLLQLYIQLDPLNTQLTLETSVQVWKKIESRPDIMYIGAVDNGKVVSTCYIVIIPNLTNYGQSVGFIENVVTDNDYRKQGLGKKVIEKAISIAREHNCYKVILQSGSQRAEAHRFYENLGFDGNRKKAFDLRLP